MLLAALAVFWERMLVLIWVDSVERLGELVPPNHVFPCSFAVLKNIKLQMKTTEELMSHQWDILVIRCEDSNTYEVILQQNIVFIQASRNYCTVITKEKRYCLSQPMNEVQIYLDTNRFIRIGRSYIINPSFLKRIMGYMLFFNVSGKEVSIHVAHESLDKIFPYLPIVGTRKRVLDKWKSKNLKI